MKQPWHKLADKEFESQNGWLDAEGVYYGCDWQGHMDLMDQIQEAGCMPKAGYKEIEENWIKVTRTMGGVPAILTLQERLTPRQKLALERLIEKHDLMRGVEYHLVADQEIRLESGKLRFYKL